MTKRGKILRDTAAGPFYFAFTAVKKYLVAGA